MPRRLIRIIGVHALVSAAVTNYFCRTFQISRALVAVDVTVVTILVSLTLVAPAVCLGRRRRSGGLTTWALAILPATVSSTLLLLYAADFASRRWTGTNVTHKVAGLWLADWWAGGNLLSLPPSVRVSMMLLVTVIAVAYLVMARGIAADLDALAGALRSPRGRLRSGGALMLMVTTAAGCAVYAYELSWRTPRSELLSADPVLAFIRSSIDVYDDSYLRRAAELQVSEPMCRSTYAARPFVRRNVIVIVVDSLRADHLPLYGYARPTTPFLSKLYAAGRLRKVTVATSTCAESNCGILSTLSSKTLRHQIAGNFKLPDLLHDQGYRTYFVLSGSHDWHGLREMYGHEQTLYFDGRDSRRFKANDDRVLFEGLEHVPPHAGPAFFYFHLMSAHLVGIKQDRFKVYRPSDVANDWDALFRGDYDQQSVVNNYDNGVLQADATIEQLFHALDARGDLRGSIVFVLADHGEGLGDRGGEYGHVTSLHDEFIRIPMLIYDDDSRPYTNLEYATQIDVAPTIVERLGLPVPDCWEGRSLLQPLVEGRMTFHQTSLQTPCYALVVRRQDRLFKYTYCFVGHREALYDLTADPGERVNLVDRADASLLADCRREMQRRRAN